MMRFCCSGSLSLLNRSMTRLASLPLLRCARIASTRFLVRLIVPSFALRLPLPLRWALACPEMRDCRLRVASAFMLARIAESGMASIQ